MTTRSISRFCGLLTSLFIVTCSFAQPTVFKNLRPVLINNTYIKVYENVLTEFQKLFAGAENVSWYNIGKDFLAKFSIGDQNYRVLLSRKGMLLYKITYGTEKHLPVHIRKMAKRMYVEFLIDSATLVEQANRKIWVIGLEDETNHVIIRVENDEIEEINKYKKNSQ